MAKKDYDKTLHRLTTILSKISKGEQPNTKELAEEFNVTVRTIQKDFKNNLLDGFPIERDKAGRFSFSKGFSLDRTILSEDEMMFLKIALSQYNDVNNIEKIKNRIYQKLVSKSFYNPYYIKQDNIENLDVDSLFIERLEKYIKNQEVLKIDFIETSKNVEVYKIVNFDGFWYLFGKDLNDDDIKTFKLSEIKKLTPIDKYHRKSEQEIENILKNAHSAFFRDGNRFEVIVKVHKDIAIYFKSKDFLESQKIIEEYENGSLRVSFEVSHDEDIDNIIKSWLPHIEVLEPERYKDKLLNELKIYIKKLQTT